MITKFLPKNTFKFGTTAIILITLLLNIQVYSQTVALNASADTYILSSSASTSYGTATSFAIKHTTSGSNERIAWIRFDLPVSITNTSTQILLKLTQISGDNANVTLTSADTSFNETATWNNPPATGTQTFAYGGYRLGDTIYYDITDHVNSIISAGKRKVGIKLTTTSQVNSAVTFASRENASTSLQPKLLFYNSQQYDIPVFKINVDSNNIIAKGVAYKGNDIADHSYNETYGTYLGWTGAKSTATGFFKVAKDCKGVWNMYDPEGYMFYSAGLNTVEKGGGISLPSTLTDLGLNTNGSWSDETISNMPFCARLNFMSNFADISPTIKADYQNDIMPVFEPSFPAFCSTWAASSTAGYLTNKWLIGYFMDNELNFHKTQLTSSLALSTTNAQYKAADAWMKAKYGNSYTLSNITATDELDYMGYVIETYYRIVYTALKAADPNHLALGTRFHSSVKYTPQTFTAIKNYVDIVSINYYGSFEPEVDHMSMWLTNSEKPFIISEFYVKGNDVGLGNVDGSGWDVATQQNRKDWFENWMSILLQSKGNVGFHWFRYMDNNDANKGLYSTTYAQYTKLAEAIKLVSRSKYRFRSHILYGNANYNGVIDCANVVCGSNTSCSVLPVKWVSFKATTINCDQISLQWQTANEINNKGFGVEISQNGRNYATTGFVEANQNNNSYSYSIPNLQEGNYYVRIKQIDNDGKYEYSATQQIKVSCNKTVVSIFPNPAKDNIIIRGIAIDQIKIINQSGQTIIEQNNLHTNQRSVNVKHLARGIYIVHVISNNTVITEKLIIE